ncbi:hypothetical protein XPA_009932 [Xanthoria parietina]
MVLSRYRCVPVFLLLLPALACLVTASPLEDRSSRSFAPLLERRSGISETGFSDKRSDAVAVDDIFLSPPPPTTSLTSIPRIRHRTPISSSTTTSLSYPVAPDLLFSRSLASTALHYTNLTIIQPGIRGIKQIGQDIDTAVRRWIAFVDEVDSYAPTQSYFTLSLGNFKATFWSPAPIAWLVVTKILQSMLLILVVWYAIFRPVIWLYTTAAVVWVTFQFIENGGNPGLAIGRGFFP